MFPALHKVSVGVEDLIQGTRLGLSKLTDKKNISPLYAKFTNEIKSFADQIEVQMLL